MGWWEDYKERARQAYVVRVNVAKHDAEELEQKLGEGRGIGNALLKGIYKAVDFLAAKWVIGIERIMPNAVADLESLTSGEAFNIPGSVWEANIDNLIRNFNLSDSEASTLKNMFQGMSGGPPMVRGMSLVFLYTNLMSFLSGPAMGKLNQSMMSRFRPVAPDPGSVIGARGLDPELDKRIWNVLERAGLKESDIELLFAATYQRIPENRLREIFFREGKPTEWAMHRLHESGVTPERAEELYSTWKVIPGIQDLIMMQAKEAFEPDLIAKFGLGAEAPEEIYEWTRKLGLEDQWTDKYWSSHWVHASYGQVMEMLHRGYIEMADVWEWYKLVEIPPYWRDLLTKIAYHPYTRVDVRRMHAEGVVDDEDLIQSMKDIGYDQEHAEGMADFYKKYNARSGKELSRTDIEKAYEDRDLTYSQAVNLLQSVGYDEQTAVFYISRIELEMQRATRLERIELTKQKLLSNLIDTAKARNLLIGYGVDINRVNELIDRWEVQITANAKLPSKTDLDKFVRAKIIDQNQYKVEMSKLGYSDYYISLYWKMIEAGGVE